ncbi:FMN reductase [Actinocorallia herbida]|uniref:FMN reductase n=1 Tax=Actinocorallia herbida TaxID=58109 RepID=A0A3N1CTU8_9ACTN|nr:NADPH-dependent FMN reductase [Actinocorallia herbida]ROO84594.1 FMN reductase [Actinocorallia herbida]
MSTVHVLTGSPSATSRTAALAAHLAEHLRRDGHTVGHTSLRDLPAGPLLAADTTDPEITAAVRAIEEADALVVASPVYKAAYSGLLKTFLDLLPQFAFAGKTVLPIVTGGSPAHVLALDYALRPVLTSLGADHIVQGWFVLDRHIDVHASGVTVDPASGDPLFKVVDGFSAALGRPLLKEVS